VDRLFETFAGAGLPLGLTWEPELFPAMTAFERGDNFVVEAEVPGVPMDAFEITCLDRSVTVRGERKDPGDPPGAYERRERAVGPFARTVELPADVDAGRTVATLEDGILRITIPKAERARPRKIDIRTPARHGEGVPTEVRVAKGGPSWSAP
jgi:HSP20 family protein